MLRVTRVLLIVFDIANWLAVSALCGWALTLVFGLPRSERFLMRVSVPGGAEALRHDMEIMIFVIGIGMGFAVDVIFRRLVAMIDTVIADRPFVPANGTRLRAIAWALLAIQLLDIGFAFVVRDIQQVAHQAPFTWSPSATGWIAVLLLFVLAEVFARGAALQDDIEGTV